MQIPVQTCLEKSMETTFSDLKAKHLKLVEAQWKLKDHLQDMARKLFQEYAESLCLPAETWSSSQGHKYPYVELGIWKEPSKFEVTPLPRIGLDKDYKLNFVIATTLDDNPTTGGYRQGVSVSIWYETVFLCASVGSGDDTAYFQVSPQAGGFFEVSAAIKALINGAIEKATPKAIFSKE
ncbi:hypothetical protein GW590_08320 [Rahnella sp. SAP-1]|uniref:Uncharacterized protein n=1 Tax=Rouxiella aceris TaxID=2703884 RepID=A0A848MFD5_9GAMM|nr:hypothetical protein [Rouxiella aceris]NMP26867.1 hypothetical protein [Rouxiella aceris]